MTEPIEAVVGDPELITRVRGGDRAAYAELYRRHAAAAANLARQFTRNPSDADDLVSESFARVLDGLNAGKGPDSAFRAYLFTTIRHTAYDRTRKDSRITFTDDDAAIDAASTDPDTVLRDAENSLVGTAYQSLPERWQAVLWYLTVDGLTPAQTGELLGLTPNAVTSLAFRAREGLREAYLQAHLAGTEPEQCRTVAGKLGAWTRGGLSQRERAQVDAHLDSCEDCRALAAELAEVNSGLRVLLAPVLLGGAAAGYLALLGPATTFTKLGLLVAGGAGAGGAAGASGAGAGGAAVGAGAAAGGAKAGGLAVLFGRVPKSWTVGGGVAAAAAAVAAAAIVIANSGTSVPPEAGDRGPAVASSVPSSTSPTTSGDAAPTSAPSPSTRPSTRPASTPRSTRPAPTSRSAVPPVVPPSSPQTTASQQVPAVPTTPAEQTPPPGPSTSPPPATPATSTPVSSTPVSSTPVSSTPPPSTSSSPAPSSTPASSTPTPTSTAAPSSTPASTPTSTPSSPPPAPPSVAVPEDAPPPQIDVDLDSGGVTVRVQARNSGDSPATGTPVSADGPLTVSGVSTDGTAQGLYAHRAFAAAPAPGARDVSGCTDDTCTLPDIPAGATVTVTVTLQLPADDRFTDLSSTVTIGETAVSIKLDLTPHFDLTGEVADGLTAGISETGTLLVTFPQLDDPVLVGSSGGPTVLVPERTGDLVTADSAGCSTEPAAGKPGSEPDSGEAESDRLTCTGSVDGGEIHYDLGYLTALPEATGDQFLEFAFGERSVELPIGVTARAPGDPIDMTGPFSGQQVGTPTTHCFESSGERTCHYHSLPQPIEIPSDADLVAAELTWIAPTGTGPGTPDRTLSVDDDTIDVVGVETGQTDSSSIWTADVTAGLDEHLAEQPNRPLAIDMPHGDNRTYDGPKPSGWTLTLIWYSAEENHTVEVEPLEAKPFQDGTFDVAPAGAPVDSASALVLDARWDGVVEDLNAIEDLLEIITPTSGLYLGVSCAASSETPRDDCVPPPGYLSSISAKIDASAVDGSVVIDVAVVPIEPPDRCPPGVGPPECRASQTDQVILGPVLVERRPG